MAKRRGTSRRPSRISRVQESAAFPVRSHPGTDPGSHWFGTTLGATVSGACHAKATCPDTPTLRTSGPPSSRERHQPQPALVAPCLTRGLAKLVRHLPASGAPNESQAPHRVRGDGDERTGISVHQRLSVRNPGHSPRLESPARRPSAKCRTSTIERRAFPTRTLRSGRAQHPPRHRIELRHHRRIARFGGGDQCVIEAGGGREGDTWLLLAGG